MYSLTNFPPMFCFEKPVNLTDLHIGNEQIIFVVVQKVDAFLREDIYK